MLASIDFWMSQLNILLVNSFHDLWTVLSIASLSHNLLFDVKRQDFLNEFLSLVDGQRLAVLGVELVALLNLGFEVLIEITVEFLSQI